jgi:hypothetical protein
MYSPGIRGDGSFRGSVKTSVEKAPAAAFSVKNFFYFFPGKIVENGQNTVPDKDRFLRIAIAGD